MEKLLKDFEIPAKNPSDEAQRRWRTAVSVVRNPRRRFRMVVDLAKREESRNEITRIQGKIRIAFYVQKAALQYVDGYKTVSFEKYEPSEKFRQAGFEIDIAKLSSMVSSLNFNDLKTFSGVEGIARCLAVSLDEGICTSTRNRPSIDDRKELFGSNRYKNMPRKSFWSFAWDALHDITLIILIFCAIVSMVIGTATEEWPEGMYDGLGVFLCVLFVVMLMAIIDHKQYLQFLDWGDQKMRTSVCVTRDGVMDSTSIYDLLVGDVVHLNVGDRVPADGIFIYGNNLLVDESRLTGKGEQVNVNEKNPFLFSGTNVVDGSGKMLVASVGMGTVWGGLMETLSQMGENETPLQVKLNGIATVMGKIGLTFSLLTFLVLTVRLMAGKALHNEFLEWSSSDALLLLNYVAIAMTVLLVGVTESVPLAVTLSLAFSSRKLMNEGALLKNLSSCETMAFVKSICIDKTGTLTTDNMVVEKLLICNEVISSTAALLKSGKYKGALNILLQSIFFNPGSEVFQGKNGKPNVGNPTAKALQEFALPLGGNYDDIYQQYKIKDARPFNLLHKRSYVLVTCPEGGVRAFCSGAPEVILQSCHKIVCSNGESVHFSEELKEKVLNIINCFCCQSLRTLCFAFKDVEDSSDCRIPEDDYTFIAVVGISNPVRPEVKNAVQTCLAAGIAVRLVTGDNINTAKAIAKECGILTDGGLAIDWPDFHLKSTEELKELIPHIQVVARSSPRDKHTLVTLLKSTFGDIVAVTGDGINDASALRAADVGLAMGIAGTEVAKENADVVLMNDNLTTIVSLIKWGRCVYRNIQQFVQFQLTISIVSVIFSFVSACISGSAPFTAVQLLWVNIVSDILGVLILVTEPPSDLLQERDLVGTSTIFITNEMWSNIIGQTIYQLAIFFVLIFDGKKLLKLSGEDDGLVLQTVIFNSFVFCQVFNVINSRHSMKFNVFYGILNSWLSLTGIASIVIFQVVVVEFLGPIAHTKPLGWKLWFISILIGSVSILIAVFPKCIRSSKFVADTTLNRWKGYVPLSGS